MYTARNESRQEALKAAVDAGDPAGVARTLHQISALTSVLRATGVELPSKLSSSEAQALAEVYAHPPSGVPAHDGFWELDRLGVDESLARLPAPGATPLSVVMTAARERETRAKLAHSEAESALKAAHAKLSGLSGEGAPLERLRAPQIACAEGSQAFVSAMRRTLDRFEPLSHTVAGQYGRPSLAGLRALRDALSGAIRVDFERRWHAGVRADLKIPPDELAKDAAGPYLLAAFTDRGLTRP